MIDKILKVEKIGKILLRFGMITYLLFIGILNFTSSFKSNENWIQNSIILFLVIATAILLLLHYKKPQLGAMGGFLTAFLFLITVIFLLYRELSAGTPLSLTFLLIIKDIMLTFAAIILAGESLKEMIREKITKPFPVR